MGVTSGTSSAPAGGGFPDFETQLPTAAIFGRLSFRDVNVYLRLVRDKCGGGGGGGGGGWWWWWWWGGGGCGPGYCPFITDILL